MFSLLRGRANKSTLDVVRRMCSNMLNMSKPPPLFNYYFFWLEYRILEFGDLKKVTLYQSNNQLVCKYPSLLTAFTIKSVLEHNYQPQLVVLLPLQRQTVLEGMESWWCESWGWSHYFVRQILCQVYSGCGQQHEFSTRISGD